MLIEKSIPLVANDGLYAVIVFFDKLIIPLPNPLFYLFTLLHIHQCKLYTQHTLFTLDEDVRQTYDKKCQLRKKNINHKGVIKEEDV